MNDTTWEEVNDEAGQPDLQIPPITTEPKPPNWKARIAVDFHCWWNEASESTMYEILDFKVKEIQDPSWYRFGEPYETFAMCDWQDAIKGIDLDEDKVYIIEGDLFVEPYKLTTDYGTEYNEAVWFDQVDFTGEYDLSDLDYGSGSNKVGAPDQDQGLQDS